MLALLFFVVGACIGSFLNVVIFRLPEGKSLVKPPSHCPECEERIKWYDNIPIISYIILGGKCRECGTEIPLQYLIVESITAFLYLYGYFHFGLNLEFLTFTVFITLLIPISFIDFSEMLIPDSLSISGLVIGLVLSVFRGILIISLIGAALGASYVLIFIGIGKLIYRKDVMGFGDIKLAAMIGAFIGWSNFLLTIPLSAFLGAIYGLILIKRGESTLESKIPYGPFLGVAGVITFLYGKWIILRFFIPH